MTGQNGFCGKELRIALVCYGGVSLAVYMHGVTKEIFKLVRAARALDAALDADRAMESVADPFAEPAGPAAAGPSTTLSGRISPPSPPSPPWPGPARPSPRLSTWSPGRRLAGSTVSAWPGRLPTTGR